MPDNKTEEYGWSQDQSVTLLGKLKTDLKKAMLSRDPDARSAIRLVMAEFPKLTVPLTLESGKKTTRLKKPEEITNDEIIGIIRGLVKSEHTMLEAKKEDSSAYLEILETYLPQMVGRDEIVAWIKDNVDFSQFMNKMQAMGAIMKHFGRTVDGKMVNQILQEWE